MLAFLLLIKYIAYAMKGKEMTNMKKTKTYSISDFYNWHKDGQLTLSPKYQRGLVWNEKAKSYFLDTVIRGLPSPSVFIRQQTNPIEKTTKREVIDGQQRINSIIEFIDNNFTIAKTHNKDYAGQLYNELPDNVKEDILSYELPTEIILTDDDSKIYDMFQRLNTNNITLNAQELRNAKYWGDFKVFINAQTELHRAFFMGIQMFSAKELVRMKEAEYISSLVINIIQGVVDESKAKIDAVYSKYDATFEDAEIVGNKLKETIDKINQIFELKPILKKTVFKSKNYFYSLFNIIKENNPKHTVNYIALKLENIISIFGLVDEKIVVNSDIKSKIETLKNLHSRRTTSSKERKERIAVLLDLIENEG
ncbi:MAG: DUF262 domain-containing protein [Alphaproteobacteria bacterium]